MRIIEILGRSKQGATLPFICRAEDEAIYYVKGRFAGFWTLCCEWIAGELARRWNLPIAPFAIVEIPLSLVQGSVRGDVFDLGPGPAFASRQVENNIELRWHEVEAGAIDNELKARVLIFDWWIANSDRLLSDMGGNPNLLWTQADKQLHLIDHNLAFSFEKMPPTLFNFAADHVFGAQLLQSEKEFYEGRSANIGPLTAATSKLELFWDNNRDSLDEIWDGLPEEWVETLPSSTFSDIQKSLDRIHKAEYEAFWGMDISANDSEDDRS